MLKSLGDFKPKRSLRTLLTVLFITFSVVPIGFITVYSLFKYEKAIDNEMVERLSGNGRELETVFSDFKSTMEQKRERYLRDPVLLYNLAVNDTASIKSLVINWFKSEVATGISLFNRDGRLLVAMDRNAGAQLVDSSPKGNRQVFLSDVDLQKLKELNEYAFVSFTNDKKMSLIYISRIFSSSAAPIGYLEQRIELNEDFLRRVKSRLKLEMFVARTQGQVVISSHPDFYLYKSEDLNRAVDLTPFSFTEVNLRGIPFGFISYPINWGNTKFLWVLGASKIEARNILRTVNVAFVGIVLVTLVLLVITITWATHRIVKPLQDLVLAADTMLLSDKVLEIPIRSDTEIGLLTYSFNELSRRVVHAQQDLKNKIKELELTNRELKDTQTRLVHSSKMVSLGQLVAGVAHELNNPISFIYSNMTHLKDYSQKLIHLIEVSKTQPDHLDELMKEYDLDYIKKDLPKLVSSCEDGARRTRDIVVGLRNFSRLEEAQIKEINLKEAIDSTLELLKGEIKNRITIHKRYGETPAVECFASQINQVFMNILTNAAQAIEGSGDIWISTESVRKNDLDYASICIQDNGQGMPQATLDKIFDPFFSTKGVGQGTGLGLSITYGIVETHGGEITVSSQVGAGTEFKVLIPVRGDLLRSKMSSSSFTRN